MFKGIGILVAAYTLWAIFDGKVYAKSGAWGRPVVKADEPRYYWTVIVIYACLSVALMTVF